MRTVLIAIFTLTTSFVGNANAGDDQEGLKDRTYQMCHRHSDRSRRHCHTVSTRLKAIQLKLIAQGYLNDEADGVIGPNTRRAIKRAERALKLRQTGQPSLTLLTALNRVGGREGAKQPGTRAQPPAAIADSITIASNSPSAIQLKRAEIEARQRDAASRLLRIKRAAIERINEFKNRAPQLCRQEFMGHRQEAARQDKGARAWILKQVKKYEADCLRLKLNAYNQEASAPYFAALQKEEELQTADEKSLQTLKRRIAATARAARAKAAAERQRREAAEQQRREAAERRIAATARAARAKAAAEQQRREAAERQRREAAERLR